jgi:hypothetical protein
VRTASGDSKDNLKQFRNFKLILGYHVFIFPEIMSAGMQYKQGCILKFVKSFRRVKVHAMFRASFIWTPTPLTPQVLVSTALASALGLDLTPANASSQATRTRSLEKRAFVPFKVLREASRCVPIHAHSRRDALFWIKVETYT